MRDIKCQRCEKKEGEYVHTTDTGLKYIFCRECYARFLGEQEELIEKLKKKNDFMVEKGHSTSDDGIRAFCYKKAIKNGRNVKYRLSFLRDGKEIAHIWANSLKNIYTDKKKWLKDGKLPSYYRRNEIWVHMVKMKKKKELEEEKTITSTNGEKQTKKG